MPYEHLRLQREAPVNRRRPGQAPRIRVPADPRGHGTQLLQSLRRFRADRQRAEGPEDHLLVSFSLSQSADPNLLETIPGVEVVSQEGKTLVVAFASTRALEVFEERLTTLIAGGRPVRQEVLFALQSFGSWTAADRTGWALQRDGFPALDRFYLDAELWPLARAPQRNAIRAAFEAWAREHGIEISDSVDTVSLQAYRLRCNRAGAEALLQHQDVRTVNLPPRFAIDRTLLALDIQELPVPQPPADTAAGVVVLDSGLNTGHPLLRMAVGDSQGFVPPGRAANDVHGHGTKVAGLALYGDVAACAQRRAFVPEIRLFSGRVLDDHNQYEPTFVENHVREAVQYFVESYNCRIFNLSIGDLNRPYLGGHVAGLAHVLDSLAREYEVLFVLCTGNFLGQGGVPADWIAEYPNYLLTQHAALLDPAPAINAITVGAIARYDATANAHYFPATLEERPVAQVDQPSPFTRSGIGAGYPIKPDVVAYGGNSAVDPRVNRGLPVTRGLGTVSTYHDFAGGRLLVEDNGTSFAAPYVTNLAGLLSNKLGASDANVLRAILLAHAEMPEAAIALLDDEVAQRRLCGYGCIPAQSLLESTDTEVTLFAADAIADRHHHFYELPIPDTFYSRGTRDRQLTVALSHFPPTRTTRIDYKATRISFKLVEAESLDEVVAFFNAAVDREGLERIPEVTGRSVSERERSRGSGQSATWRFRRITNQRRQMKMFVVVTRLDAPWSTGLVEEQERYGLAVVLRDRENLEEELYLQIRERLEARVRARARA